MLNLGDEEVCSTEEKQVNIYFLDLTLKTVFYLIDFGIFFSFDYFFILSYFLVWS